MALTALLFAFAAQGNMPPNGESPPDPARCLVPAGQIAPRHVYALFCPVVKIAGTVNGDLTALGGVIEITGTVRGDVLAAGQEVRVNGTVDGSIRALGAYVLIGEGAKLHNPRSDLSAAALSLEVRAELPGDLWFAGRDLALVSAVHGDRRLLRWPIPEQSTAPWADFAFSTLQTWIGLALVEGILITGRRSWLERVSAVLQSGFWPVFWRGQRLIGAGLLAFSGALVLAIVCGLGLFALSLGGFLIAVVAAWAAIVLGACAGFVALAGIVAPALAAYPLGQAMNRVSRRTGAAMPATAGIVSAALTGALVISVLMNLPVVGLLFRECVAAVGLAALVHGIRSAPQQP